MHRDLKPNNLLIARDGTLKVILMIVFTLGFMTRIRIIIALYKCELIVTVKIIIIIINVLIAVDSSLISVSPGPSPLLPQLIAFARTHMPRE